MAKRDRKRVLQNTGKSTTDFPSFVCEASGCPEPVVVISELTGCWCQKHRERNMNENIISGMYYLVKHAFSRNKDKCPRCGHIPFRHGYDNEEYCTCCHLWEPDWEELDRLLEISIKKMEGIK